jgi:hypothetical protein
MEVPEYLVGCKKRARDGRVARHHFVIYAMDDPPLIDPADYWLDYAILFKISPTELPRSTLLAQKCLISPTPLSIQTLKSHAMA